MTKGKFEDKPLGGAEFLLKEPELYKNAYFKDLGLLQHWYLKCENALSIRNILIGLCIFVIFVYTCLPFLKYSFLTIDRHYYGFVTEKLPPLVTGSI